VNAEPTRAVWEGDLIAGAAADQLSGTPDHVVSTAFDDSDGTEHPELIGGMGDVLPNQNFSNDSDSTIRARIARGLASANLRPLSVGVLRASQPAPAVVAVTSDPLAAAASANETINSLFGQNPPTFEGYYFEVRDQSGNLVYLQSAAFRAGAGRLSFSPSVARVLSLNHG
jgi:hypothetical protein